MLDPGVRRALDGTPLAHLASVPPDGAPHSVPVWIGTHGDHVATTASRWKAPVPRKSTGGPAPSTACSSSTQNPHPGRPLSWLPWHMPPVSARIG
jgi:hypothetical protein